MKIFSDELNPPHLEDCSPRDDPVKFAVQFLKSRSYENLKHRQFFIEYFLHPLCVGFLSERFDGLQLYNHWNPQQFSTTILLPISSSDITF